MKKTKMIGIITVLAFVSAFTACGKETEDSKVIIKEPGKSITIIDDADKDISKPMITVEQIDKYENMEISDWLDEETVIVSKENTTLDKISLQELSDYYPRSLYLYNLRTKEYTLLKEQKDTFLGGATLSPDKKHLIYYENTLGDPAFYVMNMDTLETFMLSGDPIGGAMSADWVDNNTIVGASYGGIYQASITGEITVFEDLKDSSFYFLKKINDTIYYNYFEDESLRMYHIVTKEMANLELKQIYQIIPSPDLKQMLMKQENETNTTLILSDIYGGNQTIIAEGTEINGVSWSPDQRMIAYNLKADSNNSLVNSLNIYDSLTGESTQIAVDLTNIDTHWNPTGDKLVYIEMDGMKYNSSIVSLKSSID